MPNVILPVQRVSANIDVTPESAQVSTFENVLTGVETPTETQPVLEVISDTPPTPFDKAIHALADLQSQQNSLLIESKALQLKTSSSRSSEQEVIENIREYDRTQSGVTSADSPQEKTITTENNIDRNEMLKKDIEAKQDITIKQFKHLMVLTTIFAPLKAGVDVLKQFINLR